MGYIDIEDVGNVSQVGKVPLSEMADDEILDGMVRLIGETKMVDQHLEDHKTFPREDGWEIRARSARRHKVRQFEELRAEAILRGIPNLPDIDPVREQARLERVAKWERTQAQIEAAAQRIASEAVHVRPYDGVTPGQLRHDEVLWELTKAKAARQTEQRRLQVIKEQNEAILFVAAARHSLPRDQFVGLWAKAREMFPDSTAWCKQKKPAEEPRS